MLLDVSLHGFPLWGITQFAEGIAEHTDSSGESSQGERRFDGYNPGATPVDHGFDEFKGWLVQDDSSQGYYPTDRYHKRTVIQIPQNENDHRGLYEADICITDACNFIRRSAQNRFFLYLAFNNPHSPYVSPTVAAYAGKDWTQDEKIYASMVEFVDEGVGQVLDTLEAAGIDDDTIIFFASDNGPRSEPTLQQTTVINFFDSNGVYRGYKRDLYDGGIREPFIVRWLGHIARGATINVPIYFPDFLPTALAFAGASAPPGDDGIDLTPLILHGPRPIKRFLYWEIFEPHFWQAARHGKWKAVRPSLGASLELYDLSVDVREKHDVAAQNPAVIASFENYFNVARTDSVNWPVQKETALNRDLANNPITNE